MLAAKYSCLPYLVEPPVPSLLDDPEEEEGAQPAGPGKHHPALHALPSTCTTQGQDSKVKQFVKRIQNNSVFGSKILLLRMRILPEPKKLANKRIFEVFLLTKKRYSSTVNKS